MNNESIAIHEIPYQLLTLAMALAAFLPALVYSYAKDYVDDFNDEEYADQQEKAKLLRRISSFVISIDLILTQSMILVIFSALVSVSIFVCLKIGFPRMLLGIWLASLYIAYGGVIAYSWRIINRYPQVAPKSMEDSLNDLNHFRIVWLCLALIYTSTCFAFAVVYIFTGNKERGDCWLVCILGFTTWWLIFAATIWIVPLLRYSPLLTLLHSIQPRDSDDNRVIGTNNNPTNPIQNHPSGGEAQKSSSSGDREYHEEKGDVKKEEEDISHSKIQEGGR